MYYRGSGRGKSFHSVRQHYPLFLETIYSWSILVGRKWLGDSSRNWEGYFSERDYPIRLFIAQRYRKVASRKLVSTVHIFIGSCQEGYILMMDGRLVKRILEIYGNGYCPIYLRKGLKLLSLLALSKSEEAQAITLANTFLKVVNR